MKNELSRKKILAVRCPTCGAKPGKKLSLQWLATHKQFVFVVEGHQTGSYGKACIALFTLNLYFLICPIAICHPVA
jgi:hypothetical protein